MDRMIRTIDFVFPGIDGVRCAFQMRAPAKTCGQTLGQTCGNSAGAGTCAVAGGNANVPCDTVFAGNISLSVGDDPAMVAATRRALRVHCGVDGLAELRQVHGDVTVFEPDPVAPDVDPDLPGDGMATERPGLGLMIKTADCQPLLMAHTSGRYIGALHVGWRGNRIDYPHTGVTAFCQRYALAPSEIMVVRGPSLGPAVAEFTNFDAEWGPEFAPWFTPARNTMNLWQLTRAQLTAAGVLPEHIFGLDLCTLSLPEQFFSFRRHNRCGRQASVVWIVHA